MSETSAFAPNAPVTLERMIDSAGEHAIYVIDPSGQVLNWGAGAEKLEGYRRDEIIGRHYECFFTSEDRAAGKPAEQLDRAAREGRVEESGWRLRKDGSRFFAHVSIDAIRNSDGTIAGFTHIARDISAQRQDEIARDELRERLFQAQKMESLGQLTGGVAHDFNNLLTVILGNVELALQAIPETDAMARVRRALGQCMRSAERAASMTKRLLAFARRQPLEPKRLDLNRLLDEWRDFLARALGEAIDLKMIGEDRLWPIEADPAQLESAILNLAVNARDAMPHGGKLTVDAANTILDDDYCRANPDVQPGRYVQIAVTDSGSGMPPEVIARAFEPFFTTKAPGAGTGLGLSQVHGFIKQSGGHIKIYSELGVGTSVKLYLPYASGEEAASEGPVEATVPKHGGASILLVEDDADVRAFLSEALLTLNYAVHAVADGESAVAVAARADVVLDLLLTDVVLPRMNGRQVAEAVRAQRPGLKVLYMTGYSKNVIVHHGQLAPGVELIQKPIARIALAGRIREILDSPTRGLNAG